MVSVSRLASGFPHFGHLVFSLIQVELLSKQPEDKIEDFKDIYDFEEAFESSYEIKDDES